MAAWHALLQGPLLQHTGPVFSTMTTIAPCLFALLMSSLLLLLLASSASEQVRVVCAPSGAATLARSQRAAVAKAVKVAVVASAASLWAARPTPRGWCRLAVAVTRTAMQCAAMLVLNAHGPQTSAMRCTCHCSPVRCSAVFGAVAQYCASILRAQVVR